MNTKSILLAGLGIIVIIAVGFVFSRPRIPKTLILAVPFTAQAPTNNWSRNEDCEETSVAMATAYLNGQSGDMMSAGDAQNAINQLKNWENINTGYNANTGADATTKMAEGAFKLKVTQIKDFTELDLKSALAKHHPVLLPINAKLLANTYKDNGPTYHMIVVRGFDERGFIINDPGTNSGDGNVYTFETLKNASANWNQTTGSMESANKIALILSK
ncbi:MAG: C39 family peptidase [Candidatus Doudnabacteria bacterium]